MPAGLGHQSAACGRSSVGWVGRAAHVQPQAPEAVVEVQVLEHEWEKGAPPMPGGGHTSICSAGR